MDKCMSCGKVIILGSSFGKVSLCRSCASTIGVSSWYKREFSSAEELMAKKKEVLQKAELGNIRQNIINEIADYFDVYTSNGFVTTINGRAGQTLKVFSDYCIVTTESETKKIELANMFYQFEDSDDAAETPLFSSEDKKSLVQGLMSGKIVQAGIGVAVSATINHQEKSKAESQKLHEKSKKRECLVSVGERRIDLKNVSKIEVFGAPNCLNGYLKFVNKGNKKQDIYDCEYFFFNNSIPFESKRIKQKVEAIKNILNDKLAELKENQSAITDEKRASKKKDSKENEKNAFEEIRQFKQLMDEGIITQEEFEKKKKELLNL